MKSVFLDRGRMWSAAVVVVASIALSVATTGLSAQETSTVGPTRILAPGVMHKIPADPRTSETFSRHDIVELTAVSPDYDWARNITFRRDIWCMELNFKPVRMLWIDLPSEDGKLKKQLVWYMVYSVTNPGGAIHPIEDTVKEYKTGELDNPTYKHKEETVDTAVRFVPHFVLACEELKKSYPDRVIPGAMAKIVKREDPNRVFYNSQNISDQEIKPGETVWGIATWESIDPRVDFFSVYITGLTNAYKWLDSEAGVKAGDPIGTGRKMARKVLKLNFCRPGDEYYEKEEEIRFGVPGAVDYKWLYL